MLRTWPSASAVGCEREAALDEADRPGAAELTTVLDAVRDAQGPGRRRTRPERVGPSCPESCAKSVRRDRTDPSGSTGLGPACLDSVPPRWCACCSGSPPCWSPPLRWRSRGPPPGSCRFSRRRTRSGPTATPPQPRCGVVRRRVHRRFHPARRRDSGRDQAGHNFGSPVDMVCAVAWRCGWRLRPRPACPIHLQRHSLVPPIVKPPTIFRPTSATANSIGIVMISTAAMICP